jgi:uncharacterized protein with HEPN domain
MKNDDLFLTHILDAICKIERFTSFLSKNDFVMDDKTNLAVLRLLEIIGEAANHISQDTLQQIPEIPWKEIVGFRNILIHEYFNVDLDIVWKTIQTNIPEMKSKIQEYLQKNIRSD